MLDRNFWLASNACRKLVELVVFTHSKHRNIHSKWVLECNGRKHMSRAGLYILVARSFWRKHRCKRIIDMDKQTCSRIDGREGAIGRAVAP